MGNEWNDKVKAVYKMYGIQHRMLMCGFKHSIWGATNKVMKNLAEYLYDFKQNQDMAEAFAQG